MKKINKIYILFILFFILFLNSQNVFAQDGIQIKVNNSEIQIGENLELNINLINKNIATMTLEIYFNNEKLEYKAGSENSNYSNNRIIYTWVSEIGKNQENIEIKPFEFQAIKSGTSDIVVVGEFYNELGNKIEINDQKIEIKIKEKNENTENQEENKNTVKLEMLRLNQEGLNPEFNKNQKIYYLIVQENIKNIDVTAVPENKNAIVKITGNNNLKIGKNKIEIKIQSEDGINEEIYEINVTRTKNRELADANLNNLAIRQGMLEPEFNPEIIQYKVEVANSVENIDILAIPEKENATVTIEGNKQLIIGENKIKIKVLAEDKITEKIYEIIIYRRNEKEEINTQNEEKIQAERVSAILQEKREIQENVTEIINNENNTEKIQENKTKKIALILFFIFLGGAIFFYYLKIKKRKNT